MNSYFQEPIFQNFILGKVYIAQTYWIFFQNGLVIQ